MATPKFRNQEKKAGHKAARNLEFAIKSLASSSYIETTKNTGELLKASTVKERMKKGQLDRLSINMPQYGYMLNHGFDGITEAGHHMYLKPTNHLSNAVERSNVLPKLAEEIAEIRAEEVIAQFNF